ncbi:DNA polymerase [Syntrophotalea acetylenica]|uniref:DNA-directed DNA polymerase family A palm domain-containing protein n=1 Tax=Syntrophotalea acetylenica TaxID=29542 RepID=A0A1L3GEB7_SYNAC|nr:DNA polymerase [Syntrophotalea acetylenica]APG24257.1 hypothetical protein A7E75_03810 [Syntrophotalea acetylenica]APG44837.1 hypothetical protein A6070_12440 [Syntrophotalea acetylenica]
MVDLGRYKVAWVVDAEYRQHGGEQPMPHCIVAKRINSGQVTRIWMEEGQPAPPPFYGPNDLIITYLASAELNCFRALGWAMPTHVLDLFAEFRNHTNGLYVAGGNGLAAALRFFGQDILDVIEKEEMRGLALRGGPYSDEEKAALLDYCGRDVLGLERLFHCLRPGLDIDRALLRGRYMKAVSQIEMTGIPIDTVALNCLRQNWEPLRHYMIDTIGAKYGVYINGSFKHAAFDTWLAAEGIPWPRTRTGKPKTDEDAFKEMAVKYPQLRVLKDLRYLLSKLRIHKLQAGSDNRNRYMTGVFGSKTGRNQPSASNCAFGSASWLRGLIQPGPGFGLGYLDFEQQEFGSAAALSGDRAMMDAYASGDPYLAFAVQAGAAPVTATKESHRQIRDQFKTVALGVQYGMGAKTLALRLNSPVSRAEEMLALHHRTYQGYWAWLDAIEDEAIRDGFIQTVFGWRLRVTRQTKDRTLRNFPMQGNGAEMLRISVILATERGVRVVAMVHDALLIEAPHEELDGAIAVAAEAMTEASSIVLDGFPLRTEVKTVFHPERLLSANGRPMWNRVWQGIKNITGEVPPGVSIEEEK